jgi:hypothetical protein
VVEMKKDLESIFKRIRKIKVKLAEQMPTAYPAIGGSEEGDKEEDEYDVAIKAKQAGK